MIRSLFRKKRVPVEGGSPFMDVVGEDMEALENTLRTYLKGPGKLLQKTTDHVLSHSGKRIRPALVFLAGKATHYQGSRLLSMSASMELLHTATLLHDDVVDEADTRRGMPTINRRWGNDTSVVLGDYIFSAALLHITTDGLGTRALPVIARTVLKLCTGEMMEIETAGDLGISEETYLETVYNKTAVLMGTCCKLGCMYSKGSLGQKRRLVRFGEDYGMAFQIADDLGDLYASETELRKDVGRDMHMGRVTLPMIYGLADPAQKSGLEELIKQRDLGSLKEALQELGALDAARDKLQHYLDHARKQLEGLDDTPARSALAGLLEDLEAQARRRGEEAHG